MTWPKPPTQAELLATIAPDVRTYYAAVTHWLAVATGLTDGVAATLLHLHEDWLLTELQRPGQTRRERLPVAVEASARWRPEGVESARFIVGTTLSALQTDRSGALQRLVATIPEAEALRQRVTVEMAPDAVQLGIAQTARGWRWRLYLEGGNLAVPMRAFEWQGQDVQQRVYLAHDPLDHGVLGPLPPEVEAAWAALIAARAPQLALSRQDVGGDARCLHIPMRRPRIAELRAELLALARALAVPLDAAAAWLDRLPADAQLTVVGLGRAGRLHLNVYVAPNQDELPQPGPPPGDLRRTPGTVCWTLQSRATGQWRGWVLFALPTASLPNRPVACSASVQICAGSAVPDAAMLAAALAAVVTADAPTLAGRLAQADDALTAVLAKTGLQRLATS